MDNTKPEALAEESWETRACTFWGEYKWFFMLGVLSAAVILTAVRMALSEDPYREAVMDETTRCIQESGLLEWSGISRAEIRQGIERDDTEEMYATMRQLGCLSE